MITPSFGLTATERVLPNLALDFTTASLDSRVTFTRTTGASNPATYVNSSGAITAATNNAPRFDYDPITLVCKGLLIEESRTNIFLNSSDFSTTWAATNITVSTDVVVSPDGTQNADSLIANSGTSEKYVGQSFTASATTYTFSVFLKSNNRQFIQLFWGGSSQYVNFDLTNGTISAGTYTGASITNFNNGWYRCTITSAITAGTRSAYISHIDAGSATRNVTSTGDGTNGVYSFGGQLEQAAFATSYIPTTTTALTRNADVATMTGTNFSSWFNASEGAFMVEGSVAQSTSCGVLQVGVGSTTDYMAFSANQTVSGGARTFISKVSNAFQVLLNAATVTANTNTKWCGAYQLNNYANSVNASATATDTSATIPTVTSLQIGSFLGTTFMNGPVKKLLYWPQRLTNAEVQAFSKE